MRAHTYTRTLSTRAQTRRLSRSNALHLSASDRETSLPVGSHRFSDVADRRGARICATLFIFRASAVWDDKSLGSMTEKLKKRYNTENHRRMHIHATTLCTHMLTRTIHTHKKNIYERRYASSHAYRCASTFPSSPTGRTHPRRCLRQAEPVVQCL